MSTRTLRLLFASLAMALALFAAGCQTTDSPPAETVLWLKLNDSLSQYDLVLVELLDRQSDSVLHVLWDKALPSPAKDIPGYPLKSLAGKPFIIKVTGYKAAGQLALETFIYYEGGKKSVLHTVLAPLKPVNGLVKLTPSAGTLSPAFNKDSLNYKVTLPTGTTSVTFTLQTENPAATTVFAGDSLASGAVSKPRAIGTSPDTVKVSITDKSTGTAITRDYFIILLPTMPPGLFLASLRPTYGTLFPDFTPDNQIYQLQLPNKIDTVAFYATPADAKTMSVTINNKVIFTGAKSEVFHLDPGMALPLQIFVHRGEETSFYQVTISRDPP